MLRSRKHSGRQLLVAIKRKGQFYNRHTTMKIFNVIICLFVTTQICGQTTWTTDSLTGCKVYNPEPRPNETISWSGGCKNGLADGEGTLIWYAEGKETLRVIASFSNGQANGKGKYVLTNGGVEEGYFIDGQIVKLDDPYLKRIKKNTLIFSDSADNYVGDGNSKSLFYYTITPQESKGVLVLICGTWETTEHNMNSNKSLIQQAVDSNLAVIVPSINQRLSLNSDVLHFLNTVFESATKQFNLPRDKFILGGFSMGGLFSLRYAEMAVQDNSKTFVKPRAVFSVDGPTDLENHYYSFERRFTNPRNTNKREAEYALNEFKKFMGGAPKEFHDKYVYYSTFSKSDSAGGNAKYLLNTPVRIYNDVDISWWITNRGNDLYDMNALDQSALINYLVGNGNSEAEFINAFGKGYRIEGNRHPHSWSIVDASDCVHWILKNLK